MDALAHETPQPVVKPHAELPQIVPGSTCLRCDVCCRFPDPDSPLRPYFTGEDIEQAFAAGIDQTAFSNRHGSQVTLVPGQINDGYQCPAFDPATSHCTIYDRRPFDCRIYPLALMWNEAHDQVVLGWDTKCPFLREQIPADIRRHAVQVMALLDQPDVLKTLRAHPRLIGRFQEDVIVLASLQHVTDAISSLWGGVRLHQLTAHDIPRLASALEQSAETEGVARSLAAYSVPYHYMWNGLLAYWWTELHGALCLFIQSPDGWFMPLPPLGTGSIEQPLAEAFALMQRWNGASPVSRVENVSHQLASDLERLGYRLTPKESDYVYRAIDLVMLAGVRYKSQRALCNRFKRDHVVSVEPYRLGDRPDCRALFRDWSKQKRDEGIEEFGRMLLADVEPAHEMLWSHATALDLTGAVVRIEGRIRAYTFGYWLSNTMFCVLVEVADRTIPGLAQFVFRET
ncbi:MAG TPA: phosphatidylglycerol lysyltransferase domain-containing protein, partial [Nitrospiraceae bacterium]